MAAPSFDEARQGLLVRPLIATGLYSLATDTPALCQTREAALAESVAALEAAYGEAPAYARCSRLSAQCRDQLSALRSGVDAFELMAADEAGEAAAEELRKRRAAFDRRVAPFVCRRGAQRPDAWPGARQAAGAGARLCAGGAQSGARRSSGRGALTLASPRACHNTSPC